MAACPYCRRDNDLVTGVGDARGTTPHEGAVSVCIVCAGVGIFTGEGYEVRPPTAEELREVMADPEIREAIAFVASVTHGHPPVL